MLWLPVQINQIRVSDYIRGTTCTYSQKWLDMPEYKDYNGIKEGIVVSCGNRKSPNEIKIRLNDGTITPVALDPGTSGWFLLERLTFC